MTKKKTFCNFVQVYDIDTKNCMLNVSCDKCIKKEFCSRSKHRRANCEISKIINDNADKIDVRATIVLGGSTKYYIANDEYEDYVLTKSIFNELKNMFSR